MFSSCLPPADHDDVGVPYTGAFEQLKSLPIRQLDVEKDHVELLLREALVSLLKGTGRTHLVAPPL
jgi:hypothetical protein